MENIKIVDDGVQLSNEEFLTRCLVAELLLTALEKVTPFNPEIIASAAIGEAVKMVTGFSQNDIKELVNQYAGKKNEEANA
ncbi:MULTISPECIES: hypothetical protein [unclassified Nostoc]|uniref:hypothetical protein n=1 Tax=unclassified Nostoc TaxID=2593658 RepID=UPI002AD52AF7|nr:hypothetical protein [Nostoc sp. DedQUE03]MDZ7974736.1 hypothetical protein [Nostoc sp. DedQUE03]MDZ8048049.1 hypothetical protein [Nostoc sp. DedQUE02]